MKEYFKKFIICFLLAGGVTIFLYWPVYQDIKLDNSISDINTEIKRLDLPLNDELKEVLDKFAGVPINRHQLCFRNNNRVYLIHADSHGAGILFHTDDISKTSVATSSKLGAMAIELYYSDGYNKDEIYREIGQSKLCSVLDINKLSHYASSTAFYRHARLSQTDELELEGLGELLLTRIVGDSYIDTGQSAASIVPRWYLFGFTLFGLILL